MQFIPKKTKYKKQQKGKNFHRVNGLIHFEKMKCGSVGLKALTAGRLTSKQIVTLKQCVTKIIKKFGRLKINVVADTPISKKPLEIRMGKGKGAVDHWISKIKVGKIICELDVSKPVLALRALKLVQIRLPMKTKLISNLK